MRTPNYKAGWLIDGRVAALTHFHPDVRPEDVQGAMAAAADLFHNAEHPFHLVVDNRVVAMERLFTLTELQAVAPFLTHPLLRHIVVVKPHALSLTPAQQLPETIGAVTLRNAGSLSEAMAFLRTLPALDEHAAIDPAFFPADE